MSTLVVEGPGGPRQIISAERSPKVVALFFGFLACLLVSFYYFDGTDPAASPAFWFYTGLGLVVSGLGALATGWLIIRPSTIRVELDRRGLVQRGLLRSRKYSWHQIGPFAPVEESLRARWLPRAFASWYAGAFSLRTMKKIGELRAPEDDELHAADVSLKATLLEHGPALKATRRFCDILNEWRTESLEYDPAPDSEIDESKARPQVVRRRVRFGRIRLVFKLILVLVFLIFGPMIVARVPEWAAMPWQELPWVESVRSLIKI